MAYEVLFVIKCMELITLRIIGRTSTEEVRIGSAGGRGFLPASMAPRVVSACVRALHGDTATCREAQLGSEVGGFWL